MVNQSDHLTLSYTSVTKAPNLLTVEQKSILNLQGEAINPPSTSYRILEADFAVVKPIVHELAVEKIQKSKPVDEQIKEFYAKLASEVSDESVAARNPVARSDIAPEIFFMPEEQDEENYQFHNENFNHYLNSSQDSLLHELDLENFENLSDPSFVPNHTFFKFGQQSAASVDRCHIM